MNLIELKRRAGILESSGRPWWQVISALSSGGYIEEIIRTGMFVPDGSEDSVWRVLENEAGLEDPLDYEAEQAKAFLAQWLPQRLDFVGKTLDEDVTNDPLIAERAMILTPEQVAGIRPGTKLGIYWATTGADAHWGRFKDGREYYLTAHIPWSSVDWINTVKARCDYDLGDDELEIRMIPGRPLELIDFEDKGGTSVDQDFPGRYVA